MAVNQRLLALASGISCSPLKFAKGARAKENLKPSVSQAEASNRKAEHVHPGEAARLKVYPLGFRVSALTLGQAKARFLARNRLM